MNQILVTEKLYITPEMKRKKLMYKLEFFLSVFLICLLFSYYIYAEYDRNKSEQVSQQILASLKYNRDTTVKEPEDDAPIIVILDVGQEEEEQQEPKQQEQQQETQQETQTYVSEDGVEYTTEAVLKIPKINIEYPVLSTTSPELLYVSLNKYWPTDLMPNEIGNYCIVGHYYESGKMFGKLHELKNGDKAELTDMSGNTVTYQVYDKFVVQPTDTRCTSQLTNGRRELTLITCTNHGKQRLVVKLREV
ncbi:MAG: sortase [Clostridia bacterium]